MNRPLAWTIAGMDSSGYSGIDADLKTFNHLNVPARAVVSAIAYQDHGREAAIQSKSVQQLKAQINNVSRFGMPQAIKVGMLGDSTTQSYLTQFFEKYAGKVVLDPLFFTSSGIPLLFDSIEEHKRRLIKLFPMVSILTPNLGEAEILLNASITSYSELREAAHALISLGANSVLLKGGHFNDSLFSQDYWTNGTQSFWLSNLRQPPHNYRGTGCTLSCAIAACLALDYDIKDAIVVAKMYVNRGIRLASNHDQARARLFYGAWPENQEDLPYCTQIPLQQKPYPFNPCITLGLYPIVNSSQWVALLLASGVKTIQLRIKDKPLLEVEKEIKQAILIAEKYQALLFINDYWELAMRWGAKGVHLGQEDIVNADITALHHAGLFLGVSTHCYYEVARAHSLNPSYIACGPIYPTNSKIMSFSAQGIKQLQRWQRTLDYPLVAIGGIDRKRFSTVHKTRVQGIAMISAITEAKCPEIAAQYFLAKMK